GTDPQSHSSTNPNIPLLFGKCSHPRDIPVLIVNDTFTSASRQAMTEATMLLVNQTYELRGATGDEVKVCLKAVHEEEAVKSKDAKVAFMQNLELRNSSLFEA
ncbi:unnamed protein product, partial [Cyprideis torosa]